MRNPDEFRFAKSHEWIAADGTVGITDHAQREITDVVYVDLPKVGKEYKAGEPAAVIESVKAAFDIYAPVSGKIVKVNTDLSKNPALVNKSAYENGWLFEIECSDAGEASRLLSEAQYQGVKDAAHH